MIVLLKKNQEIFKFHILNYNDYFIIFGIVFFLRIFNIFCEGRFENYSGLIGI